MQINNSYNSTQTFCSRAKIIRDTEKICQIIRTEFPAISPSKIAEFNNANKHKTYIKKLQMKLEQNVRKPAWSEFDTQDNVENFYIKLVEGIKNFKLANCADFSKLCNLICSINGINSQKAELSLLSPKGALKGHIDHAIHIIPLDGEFPFIKELSKMKNAIIIDPWLGIVDFAPNAEIKFKSEYNQFFKIPNDYRLALSCHVFGEPEIKTQAAKNLREKFPNLILNNK